MISYKKEPFYNCSGGALEHKAGEQPRALTLPLEEKNWQVFYSRNRQ